MQLNTVRAAVVQASPVFFHVPRTLEKLADLAADARRKQVQLAVFPEAFLSGYPKGLDFGTSVGHRTSEGRELFRIYYENAIEVPGPATLAIGHVALENSLYMVVGVTEREGGTLYCSALFFAPDGSLIGKHRKLIPTAHERVIWGQGDGSTLPVLDTPLGKVGAVICWENYMPLLRMAMYSKGVQLYCAPTADDRETWVPTMRHIAFEGRCFVLSACQYLTRADLPAELGSSFLVGEKVLMRGGSCIVDPQGQLLAGPHFDSEAILVADLDLNDIARGKFDFDVVGHYARPDVFRVLVNEQPATSVVINSGFTGSSNSPRDFESDSSNDIPQTHNSKRASE